MATKNLNLGTVPVSRGEFDSTTIYYKDNIVQYKRSSYQVISESPIVGVPPINDEDIVNNGWIIFAGTLSEASLIKSNTQDLSGNNVQENLNSAAEKLKELKLEAIYDISAHNNGAVFESLSALLSDSNLSTLIPTSVRHGGMSIRFIQGSELSSDNKYVQYRLMSNEWSTNIEDWAIASEGVYIENPEFIYAKTDRKGKILWAIKTDGSIHYGAGIPQQVVDYINERIKELSLDEYENIVAFLNNLEKEDKTLQTLLNEKIDKEEGKSLIDNEYASTKSTINNLEFLEVVIDTEDKVLEGIQVDGTKVIGRDLSVGGSVNILGNMNVSGVSYKVIENSEYLAAWVDAEDKVIFGFKADGKTFVGDADFLNYIENIKKFLANDAIDKNIDWNALLSITAVENPEFIEAKTDSEGKLIAGRTTDGIAFEKVGLSTPKVLIDEHAIENIEDSEGRTEILTDAEGRVISYRDSDGVEHEEVGIESAKVTTNSLNLTTEGMTEFQLALKNSDFTEGFGDWSDNESLEILMPRCAIVNITNDNNSAVWPTSKTADYHYYLQFWDMQGNYFKKPVIYNAQGNSSLGMPKKNAGFDIFADTWDGKTFTLKIGNWIPQDSFHLKAYYADYFVGVCPIGYKLFNQITATRDIFSNRDWKKVFLPSKTTIGTGCRAMNGEDDKYSLDNDARCFPDGFPCIVYLNGEFYGIYSWQLKKHRDNYMMSKKNPLHIHLDGVLNNERLFGANGDSSKIGWIDTGDTGFEIRNPKPKKKKDGWALTCIDGTTYDADTNMKEIISQDSSLYDSTNESHVKTNQTKQAILQLSTYITELNQMESSSATSEAIKLRLSEMFDIQSFIDYLVFSDITSNYDGFAKNWQWITYNGNKWFVEPYDLDGIFGWSGWNEISPTGNRYGNDKGIPSGWIIQYYQEELEARYKELRDLSIIDSRNILNIFRSWIAAIGTDNYQKNHDKWPNDREHYYAAPVETHYDNIYRISNWLDMRIAKCDTIYNYNQN